MISSFTITTKENTIKGAKKCWKKGKKGKKRLNPTHLTEKSIISVYRFEAKTSTVYASGAILFHMKILGLNKGEQAHLNKRLTGLIGKVLDTFDASQ